MFASTRSVMIDYGSPVNRQHPQANGLAAWYLALPGSGGAKWRDLMGAADLNSGNHGTLTNIVQGAASGWQGTSRSGGFGAMAFDGSNDYIGVTTTSTINPPLITLTCWINGNSFGNAYNALLSGNGSPNPEQMFVKSTGKLAMYFRAGAVNYDGTGVATLSTGTWYHIALTFSIDLKGRGYVNGVLDGTSGTAAGTLQSVSSTFSIGTDLVTSGRYFNGLMDDVRIYNRALSASEVAQLYQNSLAGCPGLLRRIKPWWIGVRPATTGASAMLAHL